METQIKMESVIYYVKQEQDTFLGNPIKIESVSSANPTKEKSETESESDSYSETSEEVNLSEIFTEAFKCPLCPKSYVSKSSLDRHHGRVHKRGKTTTKKKQKKDSFSTKTNNQAKVKARKSTDSQKPFPCSLCPKSYCHKHDYWRHMKKFHEEVYLKTKPGLKENPEPDGSFQCPLCFKSVLNMRNLLRHILTLHTKNEPRKKSKIKCSLCPELNATPTALLLHLKKSHGDLLVKIPLLFKCEICFKQCKNRQYLTKHKKFHLRGKSISCPHCPKTFVRKETLNFHLIEKHNEKNHKSKIYKCEFCGKIFPVLSNLERHVVDKHVVDKSVECQVCGKMFVDESDLARHLKVEHKETSKSEMVFVCELCSRRLKTKLSLVRHLKEVHHRFFFCNKCSRSFETKEDYNEHSTVISSSSGEKAVDYLQCPMCLLSLQNQCSFTVHTKSHGKQTKPEIKTKLKSPAGFSAFACSLCPFRSNDEKEVAIHNEHHGIPKVLLSKQIFCAEHTLSSMELLKDISPALKCSRCQCSGVKFATGIADK